MSRNEIKALSNEEINSGFLKCHENAQRLMEAAEILFKSDFVPFGNSMLILAVEEEVKGQMVYGIILNPEFSKSLDFDPMFSKHEIKKEVAKRTLWYWENFARFIEKEGADNIIKNPELYFSGEFPWTSSKGESENDKKIEGWFNQMSDSREMGLYVDFKNGKWQAPSRIKQQHYKVSLQICEMLMVVGDHIKEKIEKQNNAVNLRK